jgi:hypothetical protein
VNGALQLIDGHIGEASAIWLKRQLMVRGFTSTFRFKVSNPPDNPGILADGFTLAVQNDGPDALGGSGGSLGYAGVVRSFCLAIYFHRARNDQPLTKPTWGLSFGGHEPLETRALPLDIGDGHVFQVEFAFDGKDAFTAKMTEEDSARSASFKTRLPMGAIVKINNGAAWAGFTGGTGMGWSDLRILGWTFSSKRR